MDKATKAELIEYMYGLEIKDKDFVDVIKKEINPDTENGLSDTHLRFLKTAIINPYKQFEETGEPSRAPYFIGRVAGDNGFEIIAAYLN